MGHGQRSRKKKTAYTTQELWVQQLAGPAFK